MAGWLSALRLVPWGEVAKNAPQMAEGARKLWQRVSQPKGSLSEAALVLDATQAPADQLQALRAHVSELEHEVRASSALIKSLAEQHARLVAELAALRQRQRLLGAGLGLLALAGWAAWYWR